MQTTRSHGLNPEAAAYVRKQPQLQAEIDRTKRIKQFSHLVESYTETQHKRGKLSTVKDPQFWRTIADLRSPGRAPKGRKARALERLGLRPAGAPHRVGMSPRMKRRP